MNADECMRMPTLVALTADADNAHGNRLFSDAPDCARFRCRPERFANQPFWTGGFPDFAETRVYGSMAHKTAKTAVRIHIRIIPFRSDSSGKRAKRERRRPAGFVSCGASPVFNRLSVAMSTGVDMRSRFSDACENRLRVVQALDVIILRSGVQLVQDGGFLRGILPGLGEHTGFVSCNIGGGVPFA